MHRIHSIDVSETEHGEHAIVIKLGGELVDDLLPILRLEFDKTLVRERRGGVIMDLRSVTKLGGSVIAHIGYFSRCLAEDGIRTVLVSPRNLDCVALIINISNRFDAMVPTAKQAKEMLDISE